MSDVHAGALFALGTAVFWTLSSLAWTSAGKRVGALAVSFIRLVMAVGLMVVYCRIRCGRWLPTDADRDTWLVLGASGFFGFFLCDICLFKAFLLLGPRLTLLTFSLLPPMTAILSWAATDDVLTLRHWMAMGITLAGVAWVLFEQPDASVKGDSPIFVDTKIGTVPWRGVVLATLAALANAVGYVLSKQGIGQYDAVAATLIRALAALPAYAVLITFWRRWPGMLKALHDAKAMGILSLGAIVGPFVGVVLSMEALRIAPAGIVATITSTMPVLILPFSILVYHEKVSLRAAVGAIVAVAGVAMLML
jgi:drug/metabolite transporter (DMT)-like permease